MRELVLCSHVRFLLEARLIRLNNRNIRNNLQCTAELINQQPSTLINQTSTNDAAHFLIKKNKQYKNLLQHGNYIRVC